jgi:hypothetical protein
MKNKSYLIFYATLAACVLLSSVAYADVQIRSRQTTGTDQRSESTIYIKGNRQRSESAIGSMQMIDVLQCDLKRSVQISPRARMYYIYAWQQRSAEPTSATNGQTGESGKMGTVTTTYSTRDTGERKEMFGYKARRLITTMETEPSPDSCSQQRIKMRIDGWYINAAFALDCDSGQSHQSVNNLKSGCGYRSEVKYIGNVKRDFPVWEKISTVDEAGKETLLMTKEVIEISTAPLDARLFDVPGDYEEAKSPNEMYFASADNLRSVSVDSIGSQNTVPSERGTIAAQRSHGETGNQSNDNAATKKPGVSRIGLATVRANKVGEGMNAQELAAAVQNLLAEYLRVPGLEIVPLEAKLPSAIAAEARDKGVDFVLNVTVSHKKGGGFGLFGSIAPMLGSVVPLAGVSGSIAGQVAGQVARTAIMTAASASANVKPKDEISVEYKVIPMGGATPAAVTLKSKASQGGEDIITPLVEKMAQAIVDAVAKK